MAMSGQVRVKVQNCSKSSIKAQKMSRVAMGKSKECPRRGLQSSYWLIKPLIGQQPFLAVLVYYPHIDC